ncbi:hypothetical protein SNE40_016901 [Patella caerulea]|uniref:Tetratricopeptide repeat protein 6 n=1 Tax=Patella caerulea TaxID=87958 RepID=A0AAN8JAW1_PATCE
MPGIGNELFPTSPSSRGSAFRLRQNRHVDLMLRQELIDVAQRSVDNILVKKQAQKELPLNEEEILSRQLQPKFLPVKYREKRKKHPIYHDDLPNKKEQSQRKPTVPVYNPLDRNLKSASPGKTNKFPYINDKRITTEEMRKPRTTSVGVVPSRLSKDISKLNVIMGGMPAVNILDTTLEEMEQANKANTARSSSVRSDIYDDESIGDEIMAHTPLQQPETKPAILSVTGTIQTVKFSERQKPPARPSFLDAKRQRRIKSARSIPSSLRSNDIALSSGDDYCAKYDDVVRDMDADLQTAVAVESESRLSTTSSTGTVKSVHELVEEAKKIAGPEPEPEPVINKSQSLSPRASKSPRRKKSKKENKVDKRKTGVKDGDEAGEVRAERTVDQIIASLRDQSRVGVASEADRRIKEIMDGVMSRASAVLDNFEDDRSQDEITPVGGRTPDDENTAEFRASSLLINDKSLDDNVIIKEDDNTDLEELTARTDMSVSTDELNSPSVILTSSIQPPVTGSELYSEREDEEVEQVEEAEDDEDEQQERLDLHKAWEDLQTPSLATYEDLVSVQGHKKSLESRVEPAPDTSNRTPVYSTSVSFLSTWAPSNVQETKPDIITSTEQKPPKHIHHFCTMTTEFQLPKQFQQIGRKYHTPDRYKGVNPDQPYRFGKLGPVGIIPETIPESPESSIKTEDRIAMAAQRVLEESKQVDNVDDSLEAWQKRAETVFSSGDIVAQGTKASVKFDESRVYWNPAPPKLDVPPAQVRQVLFPEYKVPVFGAGLGDDMAGMSDTDSDSDDENQVDSMDPEDREIYERIMSRRYKSMDNLSNLDKAKTLYDEKVAEGRINPYTGYHIDPPAITTDEEGVETPAVVADIVYTSYSSDLLYTKDTSFLPKYLIKDDILPVFTVLRKSKSQPNLCTEDDTLLVPQDFTTAMEEIQEQKAQIKEIRLRKAQALKEPSIAKTTPLIAEEEDEDEYDGEIEIEVPMIAYPQKEHKLTPAEIALEAGRNYVVLPKKKKKIEVPVDMNRLEDIASFLAKKPNTLSRSSSFPNIPRVIERELRVPQHIRTEIRSSKPNLLDFEAFKHKGEISGDDDERERVRDIWNGWFDELYPPTPSGSEGEDDDEKLPQLDKLTLLKPKPQKEVKRRPSVQSVLSDIDALQPVEDTEENTEILNILREEIEKVTQIIEAGDKPTAYDLCRRGALYRKIGQLKKASNDLNKAIELEPLLLDAYWHRHLLYILQEKKQAALDDLQFIMKKNKHHGGAYRSMAEIYRKQGDVTMAIVNYTQAIKFNPKDHEAYFQRAQMYEQRGEVLLALEDYATTKKIMPTRTDAIMKHGLYYFEHENPNWNNAINDFTDLLRVDSLNATARLYRGRAYAKLGQWIPAVRDLSAAIHLDPHNWQAFYHRACIIRKSNPERALQDYSVSLLLEDSEDNLLSFMHRGILYDELGSPEDAIADFESVLALNKDVACAHVCLGLIHMTKFNNHHRAIKKFTAAIKVDPTHLRAYICRGEAYHKIHELTLAIRDFTRAIHLRPDIQHYYMYRGQLILETGNLELAAFCVRQASELSVDTTSNSLGERPTQQAIVQSFLKNYDKAIDALTAATKTVRDQGDKKTAAPLFMLLGKTQMKAKRFKNAVTSFNEALSRFKPWRIREPWPAETSEAHYLCGVCHMELRSVHSAVESFNSAIKLDSHFAEAFYQRGLARMKLKQSKGVQDFNRALAINPKIFQAYLSRACYYGMKKNYTKAILNCNEALKLQPNSVRAYLYRGALKFHIRVYDLAIKDLSKAASIDNSCSLAYFNRAVCYQESKMFDKALMDYGIVLLLGDQLLLKVFINRGLLYFERKDYANALYDFQMSVKLSPENHRIHHTLGLCYHKLDCLQEAVKTFTQCLEIKPFFLDGLISRGNVYMDYGNKDGLIFARRDYQRALKLNPMCLPARVNLAYTLQVEGHLMQAWRQFTAAIEVKPTFKPALEGRAIINLQMSSTFAASQDITASIKVAPTAELLTNRGVINQFMNDSTNAMKDYQQAVKLDGTYSLAYFNMGNINFHTRHFKQALYNYDKAIEFNKKDESAFLNRAITKVLLRDAQGALIDFKAAIKLSPHSAHMYFNRGNLYSSLQQYDKAEKDYTKALELVPDDALTLKRRADVRGKLGRRQEAVADYKHAIEIQGRPKRVQ